MQHFSLSVCDYISAQVERYTQKGDIGKALIMLPSFPASVMVNIGRELEAQVMPLVNRFVYKIAKPLWEEWLADGDSMDSGLLNEAREKGWLDELGNLTNYRNEVAGNQEETAAVILGGMDHVTDAGSLADFHQCSIQTIWEWPQGMNTNFEMWAKGCLDDYKIAYEDEAPKHFDEVLKALLTRVPVDIIRISEFLDQLDLSGVQDGRDAEQALLGGLGFFNLPDLTAFKFGGRHKFAPYIDNALSFFSYGIFLEERSRKKALKAVKGYQQKHAKENLPFQNEQIGPFKTDDEFLGGLAEYISGSGTKIRQELLDCDFIVIWDKILKYKNKKDPKPPKTTIKKLSTDPLESVLTGIWITLGEYRKVSEKIGIVAHDALKKIRIKSFLFKHDCDGGSQEERKESARDNIEKVMGGLDKWLQNYIEIERRDGEYKVEIVSELIHREMDFQYSAVAEPVLGFKIVIEYGEDKKTISQRFFIRLPQVSPYRTAVELFQSASRDLDKKSVLPVFSIPYFEELMLAKDEDEANRVLMQGVREENRSVDLLKPILEDLETDEKIFGDRLQALSYNYNQFISLASKSGMFHALAEKWVELRTSLTEAFDVYLEDNSSVQREKGVILARAFLMVNADSSADDVEWVWQRYEKAAAVTVLHPALLELIHARVLYLFDCFNAEVARQLSTTDRKNFKKSTWDYYLDLSTIKMPLCGLLRNEDLVFETAIRGENLVHRIGGDKDSEAALSTRLLLKYDAFEDEDISDREMFHETRESLMLFRIIKNYWKLHPHATDGISLAVYQNQDIQPVIAAIDQFISDSERLEEDLDSVFHVSITLFSESCDDTGISRWIEQWKERWEAAENHSKFAHYRSCRLSVSHRIVTSHDNYSQFIHIIDSSLEADIAVLSHFISAGVKGNRMEPVPAPHDVTSRPIQFPILEKAFCSPAERHHRDERYRVLSNRQFMVATKHLDVLARLKGMASGNHIALGRGDFSPWRGVIDALHKNVEWVVCIDSSIDEQLLRQGKDSSIRDLIGFGSGVGSHGEANYTISTELFHFSDLLHKLKASISNVVEGWTKADHIQAAQFAIEQAKGLSGLSLIRATGVSQHIRDVLAYALARVKFSTNKDTLCDQFISLDAYQHWFDNASSKMRPDILYLAASLTEEGVLHLDMRIIECKLGKKSDIHLEKAREQVDCGLRHLIPSFMPRQENDLSERPDARYWWLQLHRLIASKLQVNKKNTGVMLTALERLANGEFSVSWGGAFFTCWTDIRTENRKKASWTFSFREHELSIIHVALGSYEMKALCADVQNEPFEWGEHLMSYEYQVNSFQRSNMNGSTQEDDEEESVTIPTDTDPDQKTEQNGQDENEKDDSKLETGSDDSQNPQPPAKPGVEPVLKPQIPERIFFGESVNGSRRIFWEFGHHGLNNRHLLIFGSSGMGKTYAIQCLLTELGASSQNSLVVDYTNGFLPNQLENVTREQLKPEQHFIQQEPLPISPFKLQEIAYGGGAPILESSPTAAKRISAIFKTVYNLGDQQFSVLFDAIISGMQTYGNAFQLDGLLEVLEDYLEDKKHNNSTVQSTLSKLKPFVMERPFASDADGMGWEKLFEDEKNKSHVFQLAGLDMHSQRLVTEFILWDLWAFARGGGNKDVPRVVVLDEVQNLDQRLESPLGKYLTEGRKFGLALISATQTLSNLTSEQQARLFLSGHKLFFKPAETEIKEYANVLSNATGDTTNIWIERLSKLEKGECYSLGPSLGDDGSFKPKLDVKIRIAAMEDRNLNG